MSFNGKNNPESPGLRKRGDSIDPKTVPISGLKPTAVEFTPSLLPPSTKSLNAFAVDFKPGPAGGLKADAPVFVLEPEKKPVIKIPEFIPERLPDEKLDEPIFIINNRELTDDDLNFQIVEEVIKVDIKNVYQYDEIVKIAKEFRQNPSFEKVSENIKKISSRVINNIKVKPVHKKSKDNFKSKPD